MYYREKESLSNTGRLGVLSLKNSSIVLRGQYGAQLNYGDLVPENYQPLLLYPSEDSQVLSTEFLMQFDRPISLIVPDGNWRQAGKMHKREQLLKEVPRVRLESHFDSKYLLRREHRREGMCTLEAIARAFGILENLEVQQELEKVFLKMNYRVYWSRGKMPLDEAKPYLPQDLGV